MQELQIHMSCDNQSLMHDTGIVANKMLKTLLSHSTVSSLDEQQQKMITTTEVTDKQLNLRKILYETDRSNCDKEGDMQNTSQQTPSNNDNSHNDDDDRLVIDISDDEHSSSNNNNNKNNNNNNDSNSNHNNNNNNSTERSKGKSMPLLVDAADHEVYKKKKISTSEMPTASITSQNKPLVLRQCSLPKSIYLNTSESGVKIDILTPISQPNQSQSPFTSTLKSSLRESTLNRSSSSSQNHRASTPLTPHTELEMINNEIDLLFGQKSTNILKLLTEFISNHITRNIFENKMKVYCDITLTDLVFVTKNLIKKYKFEPNQNYKEFSKIKYLQFPTTYHNLVNYFDNILKTISQEQFLNILKLYEIIIKEMMNINKTKVIQYLLDFMIIRKNMDLDMLNYNYKTNFAISMQMNDEQQVQYPDSTNNIGVQTIQPSADDSFSYLSQNFCFIARSNPTWQTAKSQFITSVKSLCKTRMSSAEQLKRYEMKPFDNNHRGLKSRGAKTHSIDDEAEINNIKIGMHKRQQHNQHLQAALRAPPQQQQQHLQQQHQLQQQKQLQHQQHLQQMQQQQQQLQQQQFQMPQLQRQHSPVLIVVDSPPQTSPPYHAIVKIPPQIQVVPQQEVHIQRPILMHRDPSLSIEHIQPNSTRRNSVKSIIEVPAELTVAKPTRKPPPRRQTIHERQVITEPIALNLTPINIENVENAPKKGKKIARRQSCHERTQMNTIERNCVSFLDEFESRVAENGIRELELAEIKKQHQRTQELLLRHQKEQQKIHDEKRSYSIRPASQPKKAVRFNDDENQMVTNQVSYNHNQPENMPRHYQAVSSTEQMDNHQRQVRFERMQAREISQYNSQREQQLLQQQHQQQQQQQQQLHIRERSPIRQAELMREHHPERHHSERHHSERHHSERHHSERLHQQQKQQQYSTPTALQYENIQRNYERAVQQEQLNHQQNHREMVEDGSPVHLLQSHQQYVEQMKSLQQFNGRSQHHHLQQQPIQVRLSGPSRDEHQDRSPETLYYPQEIRQSPQTYQNTSSSSTSSVTRMVSPQWQLPSREQSPIEYEQHDQHLTKLSLQRKTLMKVKNKTKYVEPNQNHNPFYHSAPLTYYSNPYIFTRPQPTVEPTSSVHNKNQTSFENPQNNSIPQLHQSIVHQTSYPPSQFPYYATQRFPLPPVPPFKEIAKQVASPTESGAPIHRTGYPDPPTDFLRKFYNKNNF